MKNTLVLTGGLMLIAGSLAILVALFWEETAELLRFFGRSINAEAGSRIWKVGLVTAVVGIALLYLSR